MDKLIFPNATFAVTEVLFNAVDVIKGVFLRPSGSSKTLKETVVCGDLFHANVKIDLIKPLSMTCHACAVDEFEYDFTSTNPFNWDLQPFSVDGSGPSGSAPSINYIGGGKEYTTNSEKAHHVSHRAATVAEIFDDSAEEPEEEEKDDDSKEKHKQEPYSYVSCSSVSCSSDVPSLRDYESDEYVLDEEMKMHLETNECPAMVTKYK
ncbi:hypothetical protein FOA43_002076 [Brettanomyces nanus]|uniref:Uncharacterized protein n=1 Tax=Eeniella nana TaxID=13502 RepID=A0A875S1F2_EENNA|nr:uncharacterized protein FOA43_002076 [Brettanomyces nanus]QPG74743.1 hypothetical protein FOA43_002076 [Brettanomyces nanus]